MKPSRVICLWAVLLLGWAADGQAQGHKLKVLTSFLPVYCFTVNVAGGLADVENLLPPGADPHEFQFTPREIKKLQAADLVVINGLQLESWLDRVVAAQGNSKTVVEAAAGLSSELITNAEASVPNPHIWLDPKLAAHSVTNILLALQKADPANAAAYEQNARHFVVQLEKLDTDLQTGLAPLKGKAIVTYHDAFPYFARRYSLRIAGVIEKVEDVQPSPRYLGALGRIIREEQVKVIFSEVQSPARLPEQIGSDYHVAVAQLDTLETGEFKPDAYEAGMRANLEVLEKVLK